MRDFDLARILQNERDAALIKIAALEDRFATELDLQPLVCDPEDFGVEYSTSDKRVMGMIKDAMPRLLRKGEKVDPQPEDFKHLPKPSEYEQVGAAVEAEKRKRLAGKAPIAAEDSDDLSWVTIDTQVSSNPAQNGDQNAGSTNTLPTAHVPRYVSIAVSDDQPEALADAPAESQLVDEDSSVLRFYENECS